MREARAVKLVAGQASSVGCTRAELNGRVAADQNEGSAGWMVGGVLLPIIMPLIAMASDPVPSAGALTGVDASDVACFNDGYRNRGRGKKMMAGWIGSAIGIAVSVALIAATTNDRGY